MTRLRQTRCLRTGRGEPKILAPFGPSPFLHSDAIRPCVNKIFPTHHHNSDLC